MKFDQLRTGVVLRYPYLWAREAAGGETEGRKPQPTVVGVRVPKPNGEDALLLFAITSQPQRPGRLAAEIPEIEKRRAGLDSQIGLWIMLDEYNLDTIGLSFYLEPEPPMGRFSQAFFLPLMRAFIARGSSTRGVDRAR